LQQLEASYNSHSNSIAMLKHAESRLSSCFPHHEYSSPFSLEALVEQPQSPNSRQPSQVSDENGGGFTESRGSTGSMKCLGGTRHRKDPATAFFQGSMKDSPSYARLHKNCLHQRNISFLVSFFTLQAKEQL
jgi:hypothetical protein